MRDRQVEVVPGNHVVVRVAGALVLVAHRAPGPVREDSVAMRVAEALSQLVFEATEQAPGGPGRLVAREATNWLMRDAEQFSPGMPVDLGILSQAETGGLAIFLHGAVTAMLVGAEGVEYHHGVAAAFTVDRVASTPARAAAIFADDESAGDPELPDRGIGALGEGVAPASGAVIWFEGRRSRARERDEEPGGQHRPATTGSVPFADAPQPPPLPSPGPGGDSVLPSAAPTPPPLPSVPPPLPNAGPDMASRLAQTQLGRPSSVPPQPTPEPTPERGAASGIRVLGFKCARAHPSDPRSAFCTVCGMPVDQTQPPSDVLRPPLGVLVLDDGTTFTLAADAVLGRDPQNSDAAQRGMTPFKIEDNSGGMSRAHAEIRLVNWDVTIVDRGSTNGTRARLPGYQDWIHLVPNQPLALMHGTELMLGNRVLRYDPAAAPPF